MPRKKVQKPLDRISRKRGRKPQVQPSEVFGRAQNYRGIFGTGDVWERLWPVLKVATDDASVRDALESAQVPAIHEFTGLEPLIRRVVRERLFPKRNRTAQINFLADSLAGRGYVQPRRARDICARLWKAASSRGYIQRLEFYIECSCGYEGPSRDSCCRQCGAEIPPQMAPWFWG